jgi:hypothetical protein
MCSFVHITHKDEHCSGAGEESQRGWKTNKWKPAFASVPKGLSSFSKIYELVFNPSTYVCGEKIHTGVFSFSSQSAKCPALALFRHKTGRRRMREEKQEVLLHLLWCVEAKHQERGVTGRVGRGWNLTATPKLLKEKENWKSHTQAGTSLKLCKTNVTKHHSQHLTCLQNVL